MPPKKKAKESEGESQPGSSTVRYEEPTIDADRLAKTIDNAIIVEKMDRNRVLVFSDGYKITVRDSEGEEDAELSDLVRERFDAVNLFGVMQSAWLDVNEWGPAIISPGWGVVGTEQVPTELRRLPPSTFTTAPYGINNVIYNEILRGITKDSNGDVVFYQTIPPTNQPKPVKNVILMQEPSDHILGGVSKILPLVSMVGMLSFCYTAQMQKVNRVGAPILWMRLNEPVIKDNNRDDIKLANRIVKNFGKNTGWTIRGNFEPITPDLKESASAIETIAAIEKRIDDYLNPASMMKKDQASMGGNAAAQEDIVLLWIKGEHRKIEGWFTPLLQEYLDRNAYEGYTVELDLLEPQPDRTTIELQQASVGFATKCLTVNELRQRLGAPEITPAEQADLLDAYQAITPPPQPFTFRTGPAPPEEETLDQKLQRITDKYRNKVISALRNEEVGADGATARGAEA